MAAISIGAAATDRSGALIYGYTVINKGGPASGTGTITLAKFFVAIAMENLEIAIFEEVSANTFTTRSVSGNLGNFDVGYREAAVSLAVVTGDFMGGIWTAGYMERDTTGGEGYWAESGDYIPCTNQPFTFYASRVFSLGGTGATAAVGFIPRVTII